MKYLLKRVGSGVADLASWSVVGSTLYLTILRLVNKWTGFKYQSHLVNSLRGVNWPAPVLDRPCRVMISRRVAELVAIYPHPDEFDFASILSGCLDYEPEVFEWLSSRIESFDYVIEVGANVGIYTVWMERRLRQSPRLRGLFAFEPSREAFRRLVHNCAANDARCVSLLNLALGESVGVLNFYEPRGHLTNGSFSRSFAAKFSAEVDERLVSVVPGDAFARTLVPGSKVLLKIDAEGFEGAVVRGFEYLLGHFQVTLIAEVLPEFESNILATLAKCCDFEREVIGHRDSVFHCVPRRQIASAVPGADPCAA